MVRTVQRYAVVGAGARSRYYVRALAGPHREVGRVAAVVDVNQGRARRLAAIVHELDPTAPAPSGYRPDQLERALAEHEVDRVLITSPDATHAEIIDRCLRAGADVVVEKPLTTDAAGCRLVSRAIRDTGRDVVVAFNYRYAPRNGAVRAALAGGAIGRVTQVHFEWVLDTVHGADYFRRWHRDKAVSGGLLVHKAAHHFDLVNWWLDDAPERIFASGGLRFYGAANARSRGEAPRPARGSVGAPSADPFRLDMRRHPEMVDLYLDHEHEDGYLRDRDPFAEDVSIEDSLSLLVDYRGGASMTYALTAFSPWEGYRVGFTGTKGRLELEVVERSSVIPTADGVRVVDPSLGEDAAALAGARPPGSRLTRQRRWEPAEEIPIARVAGSHGGGDALLFADLFRGADPGDPLRRAATVRDGIDAVAVGIAGNVSMETGQAVRVADLDLDAHRPDDHPHHPPTEGRPCPEP